MAGTLVKLSLRQLYSIKHALKEYAKREVISEEDLLSEEFLIKKIENEILGMKERHNIIG